MRLLHTMLRVGDMDRSVSQWTVLKLNTRKPWIL